MIQKAVDNFVSSLVLKCGLFVNHFIFMTIFGLRSCG